MEGLADEFQDWEVLLLNKSANEDMTDDLDFDLDLDLEGIQQTDSSSGGINIIRSDDYFSLHSHSHSHGNNYYARTTVQEEEEEEEEPSSVESHNPIPTRLHPKVSEEEEVEELLLSDSSIDHPSIIDLQFSDFDVKNELGFPENAKNELGFQGIGGGIGGGIENSEMEFQDTEKKDDNGIGIIDENSAANSEEVKGNSEISISISSSSKEKAAQGSEDKKRSVVWWKLPLELLNYCVFRVNPVWTFSVAAAVMGFAILGRRLHNMKRKTRSLQLKVSVDDKKVSQFMSRAERLNEAFSVVRPVVRPALPPAGITPWPVMSLR